MHAGVAPGMGDHDVAALAFGAVELAGEGVGARIPFHVGQLAAAGAIALNIGQDKARACWNASCSKALAMRLISAVLAPVC